MAKPTDISKFDEVLKIVSTSHNGVHTCCKMLKMSPQTFYDWLLLNDTNKDKYACAREAQADLLVEEMIQIADDSSNDTKYIIRDGQQIELENTEWTNRSKLKVDTRKWIAAKLRPKKYGDKLDVSTSIKIEQPLFLPLKPKQIDNE